MYKVGLISLVLFIAIVNWIWLTLDTEPVWWDQANYLNTSLHYAQGFKSLNIRGFINSIITFNPIRPPVPMLMAAPIYFFNYREEDVAVMLNVLYLAIAFIAIFKICKEYLNSKASLMCCFLLFMFPFVFGLSRQFMIDICLLSAVTVSILLLLKCDYFKSFKFSFLLGIVLGIGMLIKIVYINFLVGPLVYVICKSPIFSAIFKKNNSVTKIQLVPSYRVWRNFLSCLLAALVLTAIWYLPNLKNTIFLVLQCGYNKISMGARGNLLGLNSLLLYPRALMNYGISFIFTVLFLISCIFFFKRKGHTTLKVMFSAWILFPLLFFTFSQTNDERYLLPLAPAVAIITGCGIYLIHNKSLKFSLIIVTAILGLLQFFAYSFNVPLLSQFINKRLVYKNIVFFDSNRIGCSRSYPQNIKSHIDDIFYAIRNDVKLSNDICRILLLSDHCTYNANTLGYYANKAKLNFSILIAHGGDLLSFMSDNRYQYVIYKDQFASPYPYFINKFKQAKIFIDSHPEDFKIIYKVGDIIVYRHI